MIARVFPLFVRWWEALMRDLLEKKKGRWSNKDKIICRVFLRLQYKANLSPPSHYFTFDFYLLQKGSWAIEANLNWNKNCNYRVENEPKCIFFLRNISGQLWSTISIEKHTHEPRKNLDFDFQLAPRFPRSQFNSIFNVLFLKSCISIIHRVSHSHTGPMP